MPFDERVAGEFGSPTGSPNRAGVLGALDEDGSLGWRELRRRSESDGP